MADWTLCFLINSANHPKPQTEHTEGGRTFKSEAERQSAMHDGYVIKSI
jgi:hypothetical protein